MEFGLIGAKRLRCRRTAIGATHVFMTIDLL
jgi:hypothetical protein